MPWNHIYKKNQSYGVLSDYPQELWLQVFSYLDVNDLCAVSAVSKQWNNLSKENSLV